MSDLPFDDTDAAPEPPVRRKRVAFAMWFGALIAAAAVIGAGAMPLLAP
ncbi:MAG: hypothetical protein ACOYM8_03635 [Caulobacterales bacterium]